MYSRSFANGLRELARPAPIKAIDIQFYFCQIKLEIIPKKPMEHKLVLELWYYALPLKL